MKFSELRGSSPSQRATAIPWRAAGIVGGDRVIFYIKGNDYRLVVRIGYKARIVGTRAEYDAMDVEEV